MKGSIFFCCLLWGSWNAILLVIDLCRVIRSTGGQCRYILYECSDANGHILARYFLTFVKTTVGDDTVCFLSYCTRMAFGSGKSENAHSQICVFDTNGAAVTRRLITACVGAITIVTLFDYYWFYQMVSRGNRAVKEVGNRVVKEVIILVMGVTGITSNYSRAEVHC